jgi:hypothetical protein
MRRRSEAAIEIRPHAGVDENSMARKPELKGIVRRPHSGHGVNADIPFNSDRKAICFTSQSETWQTQLSGSNPRVQP